MSATTAKKIQVCIAFYIIAFWVLLALCGCGDVDKPLPTTGQIVPLPLGMDAEVYVIDECEYIGSAVLNSKNSWLTHKGNCKYCADRLHKALLLLK